MKYLCFVEIVCVFIQIFSFNQKPAEDEDDDNDLSDSSDSAYSGLEDSGSDSDEDQEEEQQGSDDDDDDDVKAEPKQDEPVRLSLYLYCVVGITCLYSIINALLCPQAVEGERGQNKGGEVKNDEYEHDSSDEEVR